MKTYYEIKCYADEECVLSYCFRGNLKEYSETICNIQRKYDEHHNFDCAVVTVNADVEMDKYSFTIHF